MIDEIEGWGNLSRRSGLICWTGNASQKVCPFSKISTGAITFFWERMNSSVGWRHFLLQRKNSWRNNQKREMGTFFWHAPNISLIVVAAASSADRKRETSAAPLSNFGLKEPLLPFFGSFSLSQYDASSLSPFPIFSGSAFPFCSASQVTAHREMRTKLTHRQTY